MQNVQFQFQQQVTMLFEVGSSLVYYVGGRAQGTLNIGRIAGLGGLITAFITKLGNVCQPKDIKLQVSSDCSVDGVGVQPLTAVTTQVPLAPPPPQAGVLYSLRGTVINQIGGNITAQDIVFNEQIGAMFLDMDAAAPAPGALAAGF